MEHKFVYNLYVSFNSNGSNFSSSDLEKLFSHGGVYESLAVGFVNEGEFPVYVYSKSELTRQTIENNVADQLNGHKISVNVTSFRLHH